MFKVVVAEEEYKNRVLTLHDGLGMVVKNTVKMHQPDVYQFVPTVF